VGYTGVRAPFDGQMGKHLIGVGNMIGGEGQEAALADIAQLHPIYVVANISTQQALQIRANLEPMAAHADRATSGADNTVEVQ
jgi:multidrug resistance efflux pump